MAQILKNIISYDYRIENSYELLQKTKDLRLETIHRMFSFNIVCMFDSITPDIVYDLISDNWPQLQKYTLIKRGDIY